MTVCTNELPSGGKYNPTDSPKDSRGHNWLISPHPRPFGTVSTCLRSDPARPFLGRSGQNCLLHHHYADNESSSSHPEI